MIAGGSHVTIMCLRDTDKLKFTLLYTSADYGHRLSESVLPVVGYFPIAFKGSPKKNCRPHTHMYLGVLSENESVE